jgi:uncharacterized protein DUF6221
VEGVSGIVEFLAARLDEDEAAIKAMGAEGAGRWWVGQRFDGSLDSEGSTVFVDVRRSDGLGYIHLGAPGVFTGPTALHIARHDPMRVLAEVNAKRRVMARHCVTPARRDYPHLNACEGCGSAGYGYGYRTPDINKCPELRDLASAFDQHPDYDPAWRVS